MVEQRFCKPLVAGSIPVSGLRGVAQSGSAPALGAGCQRFKSSRPEYCLVAGFSGLPASVTLTQGSQQTRKLRPRSAAVSTPAFHAGSTGSNPVGVIYEDRDVSLAR